MGRAILPNPKKDDSVKREDYRKLESKFLESGWKMFIFGVFTCVEVYANWGEPWVTDRAAFWTGCTAIPCNYEVPPRVYFLYVLQIGFYCYSIPALVFWETRRKDFLASLSHHIATLILLLYSHYLNFTLVGSTVLLLHDCDDVLIELSKIFVYTKQETAKTVCFAIFTLLWISTRVVIYPLHVIRGTLVDSLVEAGKMGIDPQPHHVIFNAMLIFLWILNVYWTYFILRIVYQGLVGSNMTDVREDDDDD